MNNPDGSSPYKNEAVNLPFEERVKALISAIWSKRPILGEIMKQHGSDTLYNYSKDFLDINKSPRLDARKGEVLEVVEKLLKERLGEDVAKKVSEQLTKYPLVSTADHHSPIQHPFWVNANIISALPYFEKNDPLLQYLVVFSFAGVSLNNASGYPRGIMFHGKEGGDGEILRAPILPDKIKMSTVYSSRGVGTEDFERVHKLLNDKVREGKLLEGRAQKIKDLVAGFFGHASKKFSDFNSQITYFNFHLWPRLFHATRASGAGQLNIPGLIYLEIETIVRELLLTKHLNNPQSLLYRILFDKKFEPVLKKHFNNIPGAFSFEHDWGTYFFWAIDDKQHRVRMFLNERQLHSSYRKHDIAFTPEAIAGALQSKEIFPSMLLCYLVISLYYGFKCLGGFCQVNDLTKTKEAWMEILKEIGEDAEALAVVPVQTKELGGDGMVLSYLSDHSGDISPATSFDMILEDPDTTMEHYVELSKRVTLQDVMNPMLPEMYTVLYPQTERDENLLAVKQEEIIRRTKIKEKLSVQELEVVQPQKITV